MLVLSTVFGRKIEGNVVGKRTLRRRRKQLPDDINGKRRYWNLRREQNFALSEELALEDAMELDHAMNDHV
jgi:hypothetical protein